MAVYVIAEAAATHDGNLARAERLILAAHRAGADAVKFQWCSDPRAMAQRRHVEWTPETYAELAFPAEWFPRLRSAAQAVQLDFMCTVFLPDDIPVIAPYVDRFKIASLESLDEAFLAAHRPYDKPTYASAGCNRPVSAAWPMWLHCVSGYPTPNEEANLRVLRVLFWGVSDHTRSLLAGAVAVGCGAVVLEKHVRAPDTRPTNPDFAVSLLPSQLARYIRYVREAEVLLGNGVRRVMPSEAPLLPHRVGV